MKRYLLTALAAFGLPIMTLAYDTMAPEVRVFDSSFTQTASFTALNGTFDGGMDVAVGDVDGDGDDETIIVELICSCVNR